MVQRTMIAGAALSATLLAHLLSVGQLHFSAVIPVLMMIAICAFTRRRRQSFGPRRSVSVVGEMVFLQAAMHATMVLVPVLVGVHQHQPDPLVSGWAIIAHLIAATLFSGIAVAGERVLEALVRVIDDVFITSKRRRGLPRVSFARRSRLRVQTPAGSAPRMHPTRGPPSPMSVAVI